MSSLTTIYTSTVGCHQHKILQNFRSILEIVKQTSDCVGKLNVTDPTAIDFRYRPNLTIALAQSDLWWSGCPIAPYNDILSFNFAVPIYSDR